MVVVTRSPRGVHPSKPSAAVIQGDLHSSPPLGSSNSTQASKKRKTVVPLSSSSSILEEENEEDVNKLVEGFQKKSLVLLAKKSVSKYPILIDESVRKLAVFNPALRKIIVTNLLWSTTAETLTSVFSAFGEIENYHMPCTSMSMSTWDVNLHEDGAHAYILFKSRSGALSALKQPYKMIDDSPTLCKLESLEVVTSNFLLTVPPGYHGTTSESPSSVEEEEPVDDLLEGFGRDYLLFFIKEAMSKYPDLIETALKLADLDCRLLQVLVSNLRVRTTARTLKAFFGKFGEVQGILCIEDCVLDENEGSVIVVFKHRNGARKAVKERYTEAEFGIGGYIECMAVSLDIS